jgi:hypothetical protein
MMLIRWQKEWDMGSIGLPRGAGVDGDSDGVDHQLILGSARKAELWRQKGQWSVVQMHRKDGRGACRWSQKLMNKSCSSRGWVMVVG